MRHTLRALTALAALSLLATACGAGDEAAKTAGGKSIVKIALWNYKSTPEFKALIDGFEADNPDIDVRPVDILADDYSDKVTTMLAGGDTTDVLTMKNVTDYSRFATRGQLRSLGSDVKKLDQAKYSGLEAFDLDGDYFALPYRQDFWVLFYNKKLVKGADLSHLTWSDYAKLAKKLTKGKDDSKVYGTYLHTWRSVNQAISAAQTGGDLLGGDYSFFKGQYKMALDLQKSGAAMPFSTAKSQQIEYNSMLTTGKAAIVPMGTWWPARLLQEKAQGLHDVDWGMAPMPQITDDGKTVTFGSPTAFAVNKNAKSSDAAEKFVLWASGPKGAAAIAKIGWQGCDHRGITRPGPSDRSSGGPGLRWREGGSGLGRLSDMAGGNQVSASTVRRWVTEVLRLLAARAPRLDRALKKIAQKGGVVVLLDGTLIRTRRRTGTDNRKNFSGKHKAHGLLFLVLTDEKGNLIWISSARPGRSSEITTARHDKLTEHLREAGLGALADLGFVGLDDDPDDHPVIITGRKATRNHKLTDAEKEANRLLSRERAAVEHGFANLKTWRILTKVRMNTRHATTLLRALLVLANTEIQR